MQFMREGHNLSGLNHFTKSLLKGKKDLVGIQIGSYAGQSAEILNQFNSFKKFYCIDAWKNGYDNTKKDFASNTVEQAQKYFDKRFQNNPIIEKIKDFSYNVVDKFQDQSIDFIYIDGFHEYEAVKKDLQLYVPKIKKCGVISGHDYNYKSWISVINAVNDYFGKQPLFIFDDTSWFYFKGW